jgi:hypothetical protein
MSSWWSRTTHPVISATEAKAFVDACERSAGKGTPEEDKLRAEQWENIKSIVQWTRENL